MARLGSRFGLTRYEADEYYRLALNAFRDRNLDDAIHNMGYALELLPNNAEYHAARGFFYYEHGDPARARADFEAALQRHPYEVMANYGMGMLAYDLKEWPNAIKYFSAAWAADPERGETLYYLALSYHHSRDNARALYWMRQAHQQFEARALASENLPFAKELRGYVNSAAKWLETIETLLERQ